MGFTHIELSLCVYRSIVTVVFNSSGDDTRGTGFYIKYTAAQGNLFVFLLKIVCITSVENMKNIFVIYKILP